MYKLIQNSKGNRWMKDGKFVSVKDVPDSVKNSQSKLCIICKEPSSHGRKILTMIVELCDEHYFNKNMTYGYLAGLIKKGI